jgi:chromate transporter
MEISLFKLFITFFKIGAFTFGGGYAMLPIIERELVVKYKILTPEAFYDTLVVCQSLPGAIAVNFAVFLGIKFRGIKGAMATLLGVILPSFIIILIIAYFFFAYVDHPVLQAMFSGIRLSVVALMFLAGYKLLKQNLVWPKIFLIIVTFTMLVFMMLHPFFVIVFAALYGLLTTTLQGKVNHHVA